MNNHKLLKYAALKKKNRRIKIVFIQDEKGETALIIETKRLVDFKTRKIQKWGGVLSMETFDAMAAVFDLLREDAEFVKATNREIGQARKNQYQCRTNIRN